MHPAPSIIFFSTLTGAGYGLAALLGLGLGDPATLGVKLAHLLALALIAAGLAASTLHLGNPQRAWRALSQWRTSWLSREGVAALLSLAALTGAAGLAWLGNAGPGAAGLVGAALAVATVFSTGMIYASLRAVDAWHTWLTPACFLAFGGSGGLLLAVAVLPDRTTVGLGAVGALAVAWGLKVAWRRRMAGLTPLSSPQSATRLGLPGQVRVFEQPHCGPNYLTREMGFRVARRHAAKLWRIALGLGFVAPALAVMTAILVSGAAAAALAWLAVACHFAGVLVERWLFFAEARHAVSNFYGL